MLAVFRPSQNTASAAGRGAAEFVQHPRAGRHPELSALIDGNTRECSLLLYPPFAADTYNTHFPSGETCGRTSSRGVAISVCASYCPGSCLKRSKLPFRLDSKTIARLSAVHPWG